MTEDEAKVRCHNKLPPPNNLIRPIIPVHRRSVSIKWQSAASRLKKILLPPEWCSSKPAAPGVSFSSLSSWSTCVFSSSFLWNWLCPLYSPLSLSADAAVIEKHTLLWLRSLPPLPDSHWLPVRGDITLLLCLPASLSPPPFPPCLPLSLSLHLSFCGFWPFLYCASLPSSLLSHMHPFLFTQSGLLHPTASLILVQAGMMMHTENIACGPLTLLCSAAASFQALMFTYHKYICFSKFFHANF